VKQKQAQKLPAQIFYSGRPELETAEDKLIFLASNSLEKISFQFIQPDKNHNWINLVENDWSTFLPVADKDVKQGKERAEEAIFKLFSLGIVTARDEWVYDFNLLNLKPKIQFFFDFFQKEQLRWYESDKKIPLVDFVDRTLKWTDELEAYLHKGHKFHFHQVQFGQSLYRPFVKQFFCYEKVLIHRTGQMFNLFPNTKSFNQVITFNFGTPQFACLACNLVFEYALLKFGNGATQSLPLYQYDDSGNQVDNITDWALKQFQDNYQDQSIGKEAIFHYVYAVLHHPAYRQKYEINLKREFPRIPFYANFWQWVEWGKQLMDLHINYEEVEPYPLGREELDPEKSRQAYKAKLKADRAAGVIELDTLTTLTGIPAGAWEYKLGNRSALEWVLDRYKEKTPSDPTIAEKFNTYRFADYKEQVIELLGRVTDVSVQTMAIIGQMPKETV
jgi:predicted helicase